MNPVILLIWLALAWGLMRLVAARSTLAPRELAAAVLAGAFGSVFLAIVVERLLGFVLPAPLIERLAAGPIDEVAKAGPLLAVAGGFAGWRKLTISDYALIGFAGALGYAYLNWDLAVVTGAAPPSWLPFVFGSLHAESEWARNPAYFGGAATTGLVGLVCGVAVRLSGSRRTALFATALAVGLVAFENAIYRWEVGPLTATGAVTRAVGWPLSLAYGLLLKGQSDLWILLVGLVAANVMEARWARLNARVEEQSLLLADDASIAFAPVEWIVLTRLALAADWVRFARLRRFFRDRRAYILAVAASRAEAPVAPVSETEAVGRRLAAERDDIEAGAASSARAGFDWVRRAPWIAAAMIAFVVFDLVRPNAWGLLKGLVYSQALAAALLALAAVRIGLLFVSARRSAPAPAMTFSSDFGGWATAAAAVTLVLGVAVLLVPAATMVLRYGEAGLDPTEPFTLWASDAGYPSYGGDPHSLFASAALIFACLIPPPAPPAVAPSGGA